MGNTDSSKEVRIIEATSNHVQLFAEHLDRLVNLSGRKGQPYFNPHLPGKYKFTKFEETRKSWALDFFTPGWSRAWLILSCGKAVGHLNLTTRKIATSIHRCDLGMGIEPEFQRRGLGQQILEAALKFAATVPSLKYVDLQVFDSNPKAKLFYLKNGFEELGFIPDAFMIEGSSIGDSFMTFKL